MAKKGKIDFKKVAMNAVISGGTGAAASILSKAVLAENPDTMDYILIGAGIVLPEIVKSAEIETAGAALTAVGAYRMAERLDLAGKMGINGLPTQATVGASTWKPVVPAGNAAAKKESGKSTTTVE